MHLMYVDESGDIGAEKSPTNYYALGALIVEDTNWLNVLDKMKDFRRELQVDFNLPLKLELHASHLLRHKGKIRDYLKSRQECIKVYKRCFTFLNSLKDLGIRIFIVIVFKNGSQDVFETAWKFLLQRFHNFLEERSSKGLLIVDDTDEKRLRKLVRKLRRYNPIPSKYGGTIEKPMVTIVEDPILRKSEENYFVQFVDLVVYSFIQILYPNKTARRHSLGKEYFSMRDIFLTEASNQNNFGVVFYPQDEGIKSFIEQKTKPFQ